MLLAPPPPKVTSASSAAPAGTTTSATSPTKRIEKRPGWQRKLYPVEVGRGPDDFQQTPGPWWNRNDGTIFKGFYGDPAGWMSTQRPEVLAPKLTITEYAMIGELLRRGGIVKSSVWRVGQGRNAKAAPVSPLAARFGRDPNLGYAAPPQHVLDYFDNEYARRVFVEATKHLLEAVAK